MQKVSCRAGGSHVAVLAAKPPKPPCWLDLTKVNRPSQDEGGQKCSPVGQQMPITRSGKPNKRVRAKIHRTRSQFCIQAEDLPECDLTVSLADTKPEDLGLRKQVYDDRCIMEETTRKCQTWLESVEACGPPEEVTGSIIDPGSDSVDVEVPDDTVWYDEPELRPPYNSSASSSGEDERTLSPNVSSSVHTQNDKNESNVQKTIHKTTSQRYQIQNLDGEIILRINSTGLE